MRAGAAPARLRARSTARRKPAPCDAAFARRSDGVLHAADFAHDAAARGLPAAADRRAAVPQDARRSVRRRRSLIRMNDRPTPTVGHAMSFAWTATYPSRRQPIFARNAVATSQPLAPQAGIAMLRAGGNAIDAALATAIALTVVEPCSNGLGSDLFAIVWDGRGLAGLNASGRAPAAWTPERFARYREMPRTGWDTVTIPGAVSGWVALSQRYGKLPFADLFASAIGYARNGYAVSPIIADKWAKAVPILGDVPGFAEHFLPRGRAPQPGELFASPAMAASLEKIARTSGESFYRGELAQAMVAHSRKYDGGHTLADFEAHTCDWVTPLAHDYHGCTVHEIPPNGQGIAALMALGILENFDLRGYAVDSIEVQHLEIEAMKLA